MNCLQTQQTYIGTNGNLFIGELDTGVFLNRYYFGATITPTNYQSQSLLTMFNPIVDGSGNIALGGNNSIQIQGGYVYNICLNGTMYSQALTTPSVSVFVNGVQVASESKGIAISGGQTFTVAINLLVPVLIDSNITFVVEDNNVAVANMSTVVQAVDTL